MRKQYSQLRIKRGKIIYLIVILIALATVTPALADYLGPNRTVTETAGVCKIVLNECKYVAAKDDYLYRKVNDWSCSNESKPWRAYPSEPPRACSAAAVGEKYWERDETQHEVTTTYPPATISSTLQNCTINNGWCTSAPQLSLAGTEPVAGYNILAIEGTRNGQLFACSGSSCNVSLVEGTNSFTYWALSSFTDTSLMGTLSANVDSQQPVITGSLSGTSGWNGWYISPVTYTGSASDATSGLAGLTCSLDGIALGTCSPINISSDGLHTLTLTARDNAGHTRVLTQNASIDTQNPTLDATIIGTLGSNNWYTAAALHGSASDATPGSGLATIEYNLDESSWLSFPVAGELTLPDGKHSLNVRAMDNAGRTVSSSKSIWLDSAAPIITLNPAGTMGSNNWYVTNLDLTASASDNTAGMDVFEYSRDSSTWTTYTSPLVLTNGIHSIFFWAQDEAGLVSQTNQTYKVDTRPPQIAGDLSGVPGDNDWYISDVTLSASVSDPLPGSGIDSFTYILNSDPESSYTNALTLSDGVHKIRLDSRDNAGLVYSMEQTVKVDTTPPLLNFETTLPDWLKNSVSLNGTADDSGSGLSKVEISTDGGQTWQIVNGTTSWSFLWNTPNSSNGKHNVIVRASDSAGLITRQTIKTGVDNQGPRIRIPDSWFQWDMITLDIWDNESGLSEARIEISDPEGRWPARRIRLDPDQFPMQFKWDRRFGDDTVAPLGTYNVKVMAFDHLGNLAHESASIKILLGILPAGPTATLQPSVRTESTPTPIYSPTPISSVTATQAVVVKVFGSTLEPGTSVTPMPEAVPVPRATPSQTSVLDWLEAVFLPDSNSAENTTKVDSGETGSTRSTDMGFGVLWGAAAAAMIGSMTAYAVEERRKQQEERERQLAQEAREEERRTKIRAQKMEKLETQWALERAWEEARLEQERQEQLEQQERDARYQARMEERLLHHGPEAEEAARWAASVAAVRERDAEKRRAEEEKKKAEELQAGLAAYYNARKQGETTTPSQSEKIWDWFDNHQQEVALGLGVAVGVAAIILTGGLALPAVAAIAGAVVVAAGAAAAGTVALNNHYEREWHENLLRNVGYAGGAAFAVTGGWYLLQAGATTVGAYCAVNQATCARVEPVIKAIDTVEELSLQATLSIQNWRGDQVGAAATAFEIQMEHLDGGMPGNTIARELGGEALEQVAKYGDDAVDLVKLYGIDAAEIILAHGQDGIAVLQKHGSDAIETISRYGDDGLQLIKVYKDDTFDFIKRAEIFEINPVDILGNPPLSGQTLEGWLLNISSPNSPVNLLSTLKLSDSKIEELLEKSFHNTESDEFVLGYFDPNKVNGYIEVADQRHAIKLSMPQSLYNQVGFQDGTGDFWQVNRAAIQYGIDERKTFVLSTDLDTILSNPNKYTYAEIQMILHPSSNYIHIQKDGYDMLIPAEKYIQ